MMSALPGAGAPRFSVARPRTLVRWEPARIRCGTGARISLRGRPGAGNGLVVGGGLLLGQADAELLVGEEHSHSGTTSRWRRPGWRRWTICGCRLGVSRPVRLLKSALVEVPTVIGWFRPVILLPAATLTGLTPGQLEAILAHELAHVRRLDYVVNAFQCLVETLMFYHPVAWWISRCIREERENCCDDLVIKVCGDRLAYARALATHGRASRRNAGPGLRRERRLAAESHSPVARGVE